MKNEKFEFEYDLGINLDKLNQDVELVSDFNQKFMELCLQRLQKKQLKRAANTTPIEQTELQDPATLGENEPQEQPNALSEEGTAEDLASTDKKKKKKKDKDKKKKKKK